LREQLDLSRVWFRVNKSLGSDATMTCFAGGMPHSARSQRRALRAGKLFGLHSGDGAVLWSLRFPAGAAPARVLPWRTSHDTAQVAPSRLARRRWLPQLVYVHD